MASVVPKVTLPSPSAMQFCNGPLSGPYTSSNPLSEDDERRKLGLVVDVCQEVWGGP